MCSRAVVRERATSERIRGLLIARSSGSRSRDRWETVASQYRAMAGETGRIPAKASRKDSSPSSRRACSSTAAGSRATVTASSSSHQLVKLRWGNRKGPVRGKRSPALVALSAPAVTWHTRSTPAPSVLPVHEEPFSRTRSYATGPMPVAARRMSNEPSGDLRTPRMAKTSSSTAMPSAGSRVVNTDRCTWESMLRRLRPSADGVDSRLPAPGRARPAPGERRTAPRERGP